MASKKTFSISKSVSYGWDTATKKLGFFIVLLIIIFAAQIIPSLLTSILDYRNQEGVGFVVRIISWVIQLTVSLGSINVALRIYDRKKTEYADLFRKIGLIIPYFFGSIVYGLIVLVGLVLLIVPGIIWGIKYRYFVYYMVDRNMGPIDALKASSKLTQGVKWKIFFLGLVLLVINILGILCLVVGLFVTIPLSMMAEVYVYRKLQGK